MLELTIQGHLHHIQSNCDFLIPIFCAKFEEGQSGRKRSKKKSWNKKYRTIQISQTVGCLDFWWVLICIFLPFLFIRFTTTKIMVINSIFIYLRFLDGKFSFWVLFLDLCCYFFCFSHRNPHTFLFKKEREIGTWEKSPFSVHIVMFGLTTTTEYPRIKLKLNIVVTSHRTHNSHPKSHIAQNRPEKKKKKNKTNKQKLKKARPKRKLWVNTTET